MTVVYMTMRKNPFIEWFFDSLFREVGFNPDAVSVIFVDFYANDPERRSDIKSKNKFSRFLHIPPKPCVWQGPNRLSSMDLYCGANSINTIACVAPSDYMVFVSDLSVILPGWYSAAKEAEEGGYVVCGGYSKVYHLIVENGQINRFLWTKHGEDTRIGPLHGKMPCHGAWLYGPCFGLHLNTLLAVNGADEACNGIGYEDTCLGQRLNNLGVPIFYDKRLKVFESEEAHYEPINDKLIRMSRKVNNDPREVGRIISDLTTTAIHSIGSPNLEAVRKIYNITKSFPDPVPPYIWADGKSLAPELMSTEITESCNQRSQS